MTTYHEPTEELSSKARDMHRALESLKEEIEAIDWYNQRMETCEDKDLKQLLIHNRDEEKEHAAMLLEWARRRDDELSKKLKEWLFTEKPFED